MAQMITQVTDKPIDAQQSLLCQSGLSHGAMNIFIGKVRNLNMGREVEAIEYDCFKPLCEKIFQQIAIEACEKWEKTAHILVIHRKGRLRIGEISIAIAATTGHRNESYQITRYPIEQIKTRAPIWKKEFYTDGETAWVRGHALCQHHHETTQNT